MRVSDAVKNRVSLRVYDDRQISDADLDQIMERSTDNFI